MAGLAALLVVVTAVAIVAGLLVYGARNGTMRETAQDRIDLAFWGIVAELDGLPDAHG